MNVLLSCLLFFGLGENGITLDNNRFQLGTLPLTTQDDIAKLKEENARLKKENDLLINKFKEKVEEIIKLKQLVKDLEREIKELKGEKNDVKEIGPDKPIVGEVILVNVSFGIIVINVGERDGVEKGFKFEVLRDNKKIAVAEVIDLLGDKKDMAKLKITEGNWNDVKMKDKAAALRKIPNTPDKNPKKTMFKITGISAEKCVLNGGWEDHIKEGDTVHVFRGDKYIAKLKITKADRTESEAKIESKESDIKIDDDAQIMKANVEDKPIGRVIHVSTDRGVMIDLGNQHKIRPGQKYTVRREGRDVAKVTIKDVYPLFSYAAPLEGFKLADIKENDIVQLLED